MYFATDRKADAEAGNFLNWPADGPDPLSRGWCVVSVPRDRHRIGRIERPTIWTINVRDWRENPDRHFVITHRELAHSGAFWETAGWEVSARAEALLFVHGYNVSFDDAVYRTAQIAIDLNFDGPALLYSWPSNAATLSYVSDKDRSLATVASLKAFLRELGSHAASMKLEKIHVIAHSMGNNALLHALAELQAESPAPAPLLTNLIMAAPDLYRPEFERLADAIGRSARRMTLYAAGPDRALATAEILHREPRLGDAEPMFVRPGIDSIDASAIVQGFLMHSYFGDLRLLDDIERLIQGFPDMPRFGLRGVPDSKTAKHWVFRRAHS